MIVQAPGKILLAGEYAVLHAAPAVVAAVDRYVRVARTPGGSVDRLVFLCLPGTDGRARDVCSVGQDTPPDRLDELPPLLAACLREVPDVPSAGTFVLDSRQLTQAPDAAGAALKLGLGSSAACVVALLGALLDAPRPTAELLAQADRTHRSFQKGVGSGVDVAAAVHGGVLIVRRGFEAGEPELHVQRLASGTTGCTGIACWMGRPASTPALVRAVHRWRAAAARRYEARMDELASVASGMAAALRAGDAAGLLGAVEAGHAAMVHLQEASGVELVLEAHERLARLARRHGGAAKPTGAGGGDLGLAVLPPGADRAGFLHALAADGLIAVRLALSQGGFGLAEEAEEAEPAPGVLEL